MKRTIITCSLLIICFITIIIGIKNVYSFLSPVIAVPPDVMIIEGWNPDYVLNEAIHEFRQKHYRYIITTGFPENKGFLMGSNGKLVFDIHQAEMKSKEKIIQNHDGTMPVTVTLRGTKALREYAHFRLYADSMFIGEAIATGKIETFSFQCRIQQNISMIVIEFDNDTYSAFRDRNLYVYSLSVNGNNFNTNNDAFKYYRHLSGKYVLSRQPAKTLAHEAAYRLIRKGIPDSMVIPVESSGRYKSRTFTTALDVEKWAEANPEFHIESLTIYTSGFHARRSYMSFCKAFKNSSIKIGVKACAEKDINKNNLREKIKNVREMLYETAGIVYLLFINRD